MNRKQVLAEALVCVNGDREQDYGSPENNFAVIAELWGAYLGCEVAAYDVAAMMALVKIARISSGHAKHDNWVDLAGYAACGGEIQGNMMEREMKAMHDDPVVRNMERTGYPNGKLPDVVCPNCGAECATYYIGDNNDILGCEYCISKTDAVQHVQDSQEDYRYAG